MVSSHGSNIWQLFKRDILISIDINKELILYCSPTSVPSVLTFLKYSTMLRYRSVVEATATDFKRYLEVSYCLTSLKFNRRLRLKTIVSEFETIESCADRFVSLLWAEREIFDMFGISFEQHRDLRRILTDYGFVGHPMKRSFPLSGYLEVRYSTSKKRVTLEPLELTQEFRGMDFSSPWLAN